MMKTFKTILITLFVALSFASCTKDEEGNYVSYYKNKTVTGYVYSSGSLVPIPDFKMHIEAIVGGACDFCPSLEHVDYCYTDETGKFTFKFVEKINAKEVDGWYIAPGSTMTPPQFILDKSDIKKIDNVLFLDTIYYFE